MTYIDFANVNTSPTKTLVVLEIINAIVGAGLMLLTGLMIAGILTLIQ